MSWPRDDAKLERVRALMAEHELDALVVRAPDNVLYLTNFWGMKGYDACVFPREGEPVLITIEASEEEILRVERLIGAENLTAVMETYPALTVKQGKNRNGIIEARFRKRAGP